MIKANIHQVKTHLSEYLNMISKGEIVVICKRNIPIAELRAIHMINKGKRPIGLAKDAFQITDAFFDELPDDVLKGFNS